MRLGCYSDTSKAGEFDPATRELETFDRHMLPRAPVRGHYDQLGATLIVLYFDNDVDRLMLNIGNEVFVFDDNLTIYWRLVGARQSDPDWHVRGDGEAELRVSSSNSTVTVRYKSGPSDEVPLALDTSAFVEYEDFDFGLYLSNMSKNRRYTAYARSAANG